MIVMPANSCGALWHCLARETGRLGHLFSPGGQRGPWPWFPYALDNGAYSCWERKTNSFDAAKWVTMEQKWQRLILWAQMARFAPMWAVIPDVPGNAEGTIHCWYEYAGEVTRWPRALAVQNGMTVEQVEALSPVPDIIAVGGTDDWKWETVAMWAAAFPRVHLLRCNAPARLEWLERLGVESCDGAGWNRGDVTQTSGLEKWAREKPKPFTSELVPYLVNQHNLTPEQESFA